MAVFEYKALDSKGKKKSGIIDADSKNTAKSRLRQQNLFVSNLIRIESTTSVDDTKRSFFSRPSFFSSISSTELTIMTRQLSTLLSAGLPLVKALATLIPQAKSKNMQTVLSKIKDAVEEGSSFSRALALCPSVFSPIYINMIDAGESSGTLEIILERLADFTENKESSKKKIQAAMAYPSVMFLFGFIVLIILLAYVVPGIVDIFSDMNHALPLPTTILISISAFFKSFWWAIILTPILFFTLVILARKTKKGARITDRFILSLPLIGPLVKNSIAARVSRTLGSLLENGVPLLTALKISKNVAGNTIIADLISRTSQVVEQGGELGENLSKSRYFPNLAAQMIKIGETSGELEKMLNKTADLFENEVQSAITTTTSLVEPLIILIMGVLVGGIIMAICLPIFEINQLIQ